MGPRLNRNKSDELKFEIFVDMWRLTVEKISVNKEDDAQVREKFKDLLAKLELNYDWEKLISDHNKDRDMKIEHAPASEESKTGKIQRRLNWRL